MISVVLEAFFRTMGLAFVYRRVHFRKDSAVLVIMASGARASVLLVLKV